MPNTMPTNAPTIEELYQYLGIDYADEVVTANVNNALTDAMSYVKGAVGKDVFDLLPDDPEVWRLVKIYTKEMYDERGEGSAKANNAKREMVHSMEWHIKLELARLREAAEGASV